MTLRRAKTFRDLPILGYRKNGKPIFPIMGGSEPPNEPPKNDPPKNDPPKNDPPKNDPPAQPVEAVDSDGVGLGFPKDTAVADMNADQKANYWRNQSKVQQRRADELERAQKPKNDPPKNDQQQTPTREQIELEIRAETNRDAAVALLRTSLYSRGKKADEIDDLLQYVSPDAFLTAEKKMDTAKVNTYLDRVAPAGKGGGGGGLPGQGNHERSQADRAAKGREEAERRGFKPADRSTSTLIPK